MSITRIIVAITALVTIIANNNNELKRKLLFNSYLIKHSKEYYRLFSHALIHSGWMHLLVNMWVLYMFGQMVEHELVGRYGSKGSIFFILLYVGGIAFASLPALIKHQDNPQYNALGASGAVASILFAYIILRPTSGISLYFMVNMPAFLFGILYLWYEWSMDKKSKGRIAHDAHFYGALYGVAFMLLVDYHYLIECGKDIQDYITSFF